MKNPLVKLILFLFLTTCKAQSQELKIEYYRTFIDTADFIYQTIILDISDFPENANSIELTSAVAIDENNKNIKPDYFLTQANREFWITFKKNKNAKKIIAINGKTQLFNVSEGTESKVIVDSILSKINKTIIQKKNLKLLFWI